MYLKSKISLSYYITFLGIIPAIIILSALFYFGYINIALAMIIGVFSLPFIFVPFVFEYYTFDGETLRVKNILGITKKKIAFSDYSEVYYLNKLHGRWGLNSISFCIIDKKEKIISLKNYYCPNLYEFITVLSKKKIVREDRAELHAKKINLRVNLVYLIINGLFSSFLSFIYLKDIFETKKFEWFTFLFLIAFIGLFFYLLKTFLEDFKEYINAKETVELKNKSIRKIKK